MSNLSEQFRLFDPGPEQPIMWHSGKGEWDPNREGASHMGTQAAAEQRAFQGGTSFGGVNLALRPGTTKMHALRVKGPMHNTRETPVSDHLANQVYGGVGAGGYGEHDDDFKDVLLTDLYQADGGKKVQEKGIYYRNNHEDKGSISAVAPPSNVEHLGSFDVEVRDIRRREEPEFMEMVEYDTWLGRPKVLSEQMRLFDVSPHDSVLGQTGIRVRETRIPSVERTRYR